MSFSADAWQRAKPWYAAILDHPFVRELGAGTLDRKVFLRYIVDDAHYLNRFSRALATTAARWPEPAGAARLARFAAGAIDAERLLHAALLDEAGIDIENAPAEPSPTCLAYASTLQADASLAPVSVALAGLLPCFRVYTEVGRHLAEVRFPAEDTGHTAEALTANAAHPYEPWLRTYGDPAFAEDTRRAESLADEQVDEHGDSENGTVEAMHGAYARAMRFEWMFWDASWRGESWPSPA